MLDKSTIMNVDLFDSIGSIDIYHLHIIEKIDNTNERYYYIFRCAREYLSVEAFKQLFKEDVYREQI